MLLVINSFRANESATEVSAETGALSATFTDTEINSPCEPSRFMTQRWKELTEVDRLFAVGPVEQFVCRCDSANL